MNTFARKMQVAFQRMQVTRVLFRSSVTGSELWTLYLESFQDDMNPVFRDPASTIHNCNTCHNFIRRYGNIVALDENLKLITMFDIEHDKEMSTAFAALSAKLKSAPIVDIFIETFDSLNSLPYESCKKSNIVFQLGTVSNVKRYTDEEAKKFGVVKPGEVRTFDHMHLSLKSIFVDTTGASIESLMGSARDNRNVFERTMEEIPLDTLYLVRDLINQGSLLNGETHLYKVETMISAKEEYDALPAVWRKNWCWKVSYGFAPAKFRNELIGVLCTELAEGKELNAACKAWNIRVDPVNYMKAQSPITKQMITQAKQFCEEEGYTDSFARRHATIEDIKVSEILHINAGDGVVADISVFDDVKAPSTRHKRNEFEGVEEVGIEKFMKDILPTCTSVEAFVANSLMGNFVTLTTAREGSKPIFKWNNQYSWTFIGNLAGKSEIKEAVKQKGGDVTGDLRFSLTWNEDGKSIVDLDAHCLGASGHIYYAVKFDDAGGKLDIDMIDPQGLGVENITWPNRVRMRDGEYLFRVKNFNHKTNNGFKAEIDMDGEIYSYEYLQEAIDIITVATVTLKNGVFTIKHALPEVGTSSKEVYGLETNHFHQVKLICASPNHWGSNAVGNKHYLFFLENCFASTSIRGFHSENLLPELAKHRKVLEVLGSTTMISPSCNELSGLGFNATVREEIVLRLKGSHKRVIKLKF